MRFIKPILLIILGAMLLVAGQALAADETAATAAGQPAPTIRVVSAEKRELVESRHVNGTVLPREEATVSTDLGGMAIIELNADQGDRVGKGDVLARLDPTTLEVQAAQIAANRSQAEAAIAQADSQITAAEIAVRQAKEVLDRTRALKKKGVVTQAQLDNAINAHDTAQAQLTTAKMALASSKAQIGIIDAQARDVAIKLEKTDVKAPAGGIVLARNATLGGVVSAASGALFRIAIDGELELAADIAETVLPALAQGMPVKVDIAGSAETLDGSIRLIAPEIDRRTRLGRIRISLPENPHIRSGNFASGEIEVLRRQGVAVPASAIVYRGRKAFVQRVKDGAVSTVPVMLGARADGYVEIADGLDVGDEVVHRAGTFVADGDKVTVIREQMGAVSR